MFFGLKYSAKRILIIVMDGEGIGGGTMEGKGIYYSILKNIIT